MQEELENYISTSIAAINKGLTGTGFKVSGEIEFDLAVINTAEGGGGFKIYIAKAEGKLKSEEINRIKLKVKSNENTVQISKPLNMPNKKW